MKIILFIITIAIYAIANNLDIDSFESDFKQKIVNDANQVITYEGKVYIQKPNTALWEYTKPIKKSVYLYNTKVYIIENDLEQVTITTLSENLDFIEVLNKAKEISKNKYLAKLDNLDAILKLDNNNKVLSLEYKDNMSNKVEISFFNQKQNTKINDKVFEVHIPAGYDIIE